MSVGMVLSPSPEAYAAQLAAHCLGCVVAPTRPGWSAQQRVAVVERLDVVVADQSVDRDALGLEELLPGAPVETFRRRASPIESLD